MKKLFFSFLILLYGISFGQTNDRIEVEGNIKVPAGAEVEGITIFNKNSSQGTVSSSTGDFSLQVKAGDSLYFSAVQYRELLIVVNADIIEKKVLNVEIAEGLNELPEVVLRSHDLSGLVGNDVKNIKVEKVDLPDFSAAEVNKLFNPVSPDRQSAVANAALGEKSGPSTAINILAIADKIGQLIFPKKTKPAPILPQYSYGPVEMERLLRTRYDNSFFEEVLHISSKEIADFLEFIHEKGLSDEMFKKEKEMDLMQFLMVKSAEFNKDSPEYNK